MSAALAGGFCTTGATWEALSGLSNAGGGLGTQSCLTVATPGAVARQAPLPMGFSGKNTGVGCHFLLQEIFPTQALNPGLPECS